MTTTNPNRTGAIRDRIPAGLQEVLAKIPWQKIKPGKPSLKKLFGPFLILTIVGLFIGYAFIMKELKPESRGQETKLDAVFDAAAAGRMQTATLLEFDNRLIYRAFPETVAPPAPPAPAPGAPAGTVPAPAPPVTDPNQPPPAPAPPPVAKWYWSAIPSNGAVIEEVIGRIVRSGAEFETAPQNGKARLKFIATTLYPLLILVALFSFFFLIITGQGGASDFVGFSKMAAKIRKKKKVAGATTFKDVGAVDEGIEELHEVVEFLHNPAKFTSMGARPPKGVLLVGPPGTGKTLLARAVSGEANVPFIQASGSEFVESLVGVGAARVRDLFKQARALAPCIIFIDELDAMGRQRGTGVGQGNDEREQTLNQLMVELDGFSPSLGIVVMGASNRPDILDAALLRPGRFDRQVVIDVPDVKGRRSILQVHTRGRPMSPDVDLDSIAKGTPGFTGAELANIINEAALLAVRHGRSVLTQEDMDEAVDRVIAGPERRSHILTLEERTLIAYHEAGHAVTARALGQVVGVMKLSVVARGRQLGHATNYASADRLVLVRTEVEAQLATLLGGLAAEILVYGQTSTGNTRDLEQATALARKLVATWGMSDAVGRIQVQHEGAVFLGRDIGAMQSVSQEMLKTVDAEVSRVLHESEERALKACRLNRDVIEELVERLLEDDALNGPEVEPFLSKVRPLPIQGIGPLEVRSAGNGQPASASRRRVRPVR